LQTCKELVGSATNHIDGEVSILQKINFHFHLIICKHCRRYIEQLKLTVRLVNQSGELPIMTKEDRDKLVTKMKDQK